MNKFREMLQDKKKQLLDNIKNNIDKQLANTVSFIDTLDFAANESNKNVVSELKNKDLITVSKIDYALSKLDHGTFGVCEDCEEDIEGKRLLAQPWANLCLLCQEQKDSHNKKHSPFKSRPISEDEFFGDNEEEDEAV